MKWKWMTSVLVGFLAARGVASTVVGGVGCWSSSVGPWPASMTLRWRFQSAMKAATASGERPVTLGALGAVGSSWATRSSKSASCSIKSATPVTSSRRFVALLPMLVRGLRWRSSNSAMAAVRAVIFACVTPRPCAPLSSRACMARSRISVQRVMSIWSRRRTRARFGNVTFARSLVLPVFLKWLRRAAASWRASASKASSAAAFASASPELSVSAAMARPRSPV